MSATLTVVTKWTDGEEVLLQEIAMRKPTLTRTSGEFVVLNWVYPNKLAAQSVGQLMKKRMENIQVEIK